MWGKISKRFWKRMAAAALSVILVAGIWGKCLQEVEASSVSSPYTVTVTFTLTLDGYEGEGTPEFGEVVLRLSKDHSNPSLYDFIREDQMIQNGSGTVLSYTCTFEGGKYYNIYWGIDAGRGLIGLTNRMLGSSFWGDDQDENIHMQATAYHFCFMDGNDVFYEQYARTTYEIYNIDDPNKDDHVFRGWTDGKTNSKILSLRDIQNKMLGRSTTYYAVWDHPAEDTWDWNSDADNHWKECSCGELKTAAEVHTWDDGVITRQPTDVLEGETTYTCTDCGKTRTEPILATGKPTVSGNDSVSGNNPTVPGNPDTPGNNDTPASPDVPGDANETVNTDVPNSSQTPAPNNPNTVPDQNHTGAAANPSVNTTATEGKNGEPRTGDAPCVEIYATAAMIAGMAYLLLYFRDDERGMSEEEKKELMSRLIVWAKKGGYFRRITALTFIFFLLCYYHSIGKKSHVGWKALYEK